jgi:hypothetical protein
MRSRAIWLLLNLVIARRFDAQPPPGKKKTPTLRRTGAFSYLDPPQIPALL